MTMGWSRANTLHSAVGHKIMLYIYIKCNNVTVIGARSGEKPFRLARPQWTNFPMFSVLHVTVHCICTL